MKPWPVIPKSMCSLQTNTDLDATVGGAAFLGVVGRDGVGFAITLISDGRGGDTLADEVVGNGLGTVIRESKFQLLAASAVGMTINMGFEHGILLHESDGFVQDFAGFRREIKGVGLE